MIIDDLLKEKKMSRYELSKLSGVPQTTIADICSGKTDLQQCKVGTLDKIAKALDETIDSLLLKHDKDFEEEIDFELYKSDVCQMVKRVGQIDFVIKVLENNQIRNYYDKGWNKEALYLLAMVDYLSRLNKIPLCNDYDDLRRKKFKKPIYPRSVIFEARIIKSDAPKKEAIKNAIPEFMNFNLVEGDVFDVA